MHGIGNGPIGCAAIGGSPSPYALGAATAIILARQDIVYACEIAAAVRGWTSDYLPVIGGGPIGQVPSITRLILSEPLYAATQPYVTDADQSPVSQAFPGILAGFSHRRSISAGDAFGGVALGDGDLTLDNVDGRLDNRIPQSIAGRDVVVRAGVPEIPYQFWPVVFQGTAREWSFDRSTVRIAIRDRAYRLMVPVETALFAGTGALEGGSELTGKRRPRLLGRARNFRPTFVDQANLVYLANNGPVDTIFAVRDRGIALSFAADYASYAALVAAVIPGGQYATCLAEGLIRLGGAANGTVTADGATYRSTGTATIAAVIRGLIADETDITEFYDGAFNILAALYPGDAGLYLDENDNSQVIDVVDRMLKGIVGWLAMTRNGTCTVGIVGIPDNPAHLYAGLGAIMDEVSVERLPSRLSPPPWRLRLSYAINHTEQTDLSSVADLYYAQPALVAIDSDADVRLDYPGAQDPDPIETCLIDQADAEAEVARQLALFKAERPLRRTRLARAAILNGIGAIIDLDNDRQGGRRLGFAVEDNVIVRKGGLDTIEVAVYG